MRDGVAQERKQLGHAGPDEGRSEHAPGEAHDVDRDEATGDPVGEPRSVSARSTLSRTTASGCGCPPRSSEIGPTHATSGSEKTADGIVGALPTRGTQGKAIAWMTRRA